MMQIYKVYKEFPAGVLPAFPNGGWPGLSKREWFAGMALQCMIREMTIDDMAMNMKERSPSWIAEVVAAHAVCAADALIAELNKEPAATQSNAYDHS